MGRLLKPLDASWLLLESESTPMHVAGLFVFEKPKDAPARYLHDMVKRFRATRKVVSPWNQKLQPGWLGKLWPRWIEDENLDLDYHFRHSALPEPGGERELGVLVSRLHSHALDMHRPLWELHLIEGLQHRRFAFYFKAHHSLIDGVSAMRLLLRWLSADPSRHGTPAMWAMGSSEATNVKRVAKNVRGAELTAAASALGKSVWRLIRAAASEKDALVAPYTSPRSMLSGPMNAQRRFATAQLDLTRVRKLAKSAGATLNDVVLCLCGAVVRRFLQKAKALPKASLTAAVPVNLREASDQSVGATQIGMIYTTLGTDIADPRQRLEAIQRSSAEAKRHLLELPAVARLPYTLLTAAPTIVTQLGRLENYIPPMFSVAVSNVPGPLQPLYFDGAKLHAMYPISLLTRGGALNITCVSYAGTLNFGFTGARDTLPHLQRMALYMGEALDELEGLIESGPAPAKATTTEKPARKVKATSKPAAKKPRLRRAAR